MPKGWTAKDERMKRHIVASGAPASEAFATVNKFRAKHKKGKRKATR